MQRREVTFSVPDSQADTFSDISDEGIWVTTSHEEAHCHKELFMLQKRSSSLGCALRLRSFNLQDHNVFLKSSQCLIFAEESGNITFSKVSFRGVCSFCTSNSVPVLHI